MNLLVFINLAFSATSDISSQCTTTLNTFSKCQNDAALNFKKSHPFSQISIITSIPIYCPICSTQHNALASVCNTELTNGNPRVFMQYFTCYQINNQYCLSEFESIVNKTVVYKPFDCANPCHSYLAAYYATYNATLQSEMTQPLMDAGWTSTNITKCIGSNTTTKTVHFSGIANELNSLVLTMVWMHFI